MYKDNGRGIPQSFQQKIFDPFVTTKRGHGGSGLGMHLVFNLVTQALNGSISLSSSCRYSLLASTTPAKKVPSAGDKPTNDIIKAIPITKNRAVAVNNSRSRASATNLKIGAVK